MEEHLSICPACQAKNSTCLWTVTPEQAARHFVSAEADGTRFAALTAHIRVLWGQATCRVLTCGTCGLRHADPFVAGDAAFYDLAYPRKGVYPESKWEYDQTYASIRSDLLAFQAAGSAAPARLLEVGAGHGGFARNLIASGIMRPEQVVCTEYDTAGRARIREAGLVCLGEDFRGLSVERAGGLFDVVCLFQALEHLDRLDEVFLTFTRLLKPHGVIFVSVPNPAHIAFNEANGGLSDMPPNHVTCWSLEAFRRLCDRHGYGVADYRVEPFRLFSDSRLYLTYRFLRRAQRHGSCANRVGRIESRRVFRLCAALCAACDLPWALPSLVRLWRERPGRSVWVKLCRNISGGA